MKESLRSLVDAIKALGEDTRLKIVLLLCQEEMCVCEMMTRLGLSQSSASHHLKVLKQAQLVNDRRDGKWIFYSLNRQQFAGLEQNLSQLVLQRVAASE